MIQRTGHARCIRCDYETQDRMSFQEQDEAMMHHLEKEHPDWQTVPLTAEQIEKYGVKPTEEEKLRTNLSNVQAAHAVQAELISKLMNESTVLEQERDAARQDATDARNELAGQETQLYGRIQRRNAQVERYRAALGPVTKEEWGNQSARSHGHFQRFNAIMDDRRAALASEPAPEVKP